MLSKLPNILTIFRLLAVFPLVYWLYTGAYRPALILALVAGFSDWVDGQLARRYGWVSRFGGIADPLADKLMVISLAVVLAVIGAFPVWLAVLIALRDVVIVGGGVIYQRKFGQVKVAPFRLSKWNTALLIALVLVVLLGLNQVQWSLGGVDMLERVEQVLIWVVAATTVISGIQYVWVWGNKALAAGREKESKHE